MLRPVWPPAAVLLSALLAGSSPARATEKPDAEQTRLFQEQVRPILQTNCLSCHGGEKKVRGGLRGCAWRKWVRISSPRGRLVPA